MGALVPAVMAPKTLLSSALVSRTADRPSAQLSAEGRGNPRAKRRAAAHTYNPTHKSDAVMVLCVPAGRARYRLGVGLYQLLLFTAMCRM